MQRTSTTSSTSRWRSSDIRTMWPTLKGHFLLSAIQIFKAVSRFFALRRSLLLESPGSKTTNHSMKSSDYSNKTTCYTERSVICTRVCLGMQLTSLLTSWSSRQVLNTVSTSHFSPKTRSRQSSLRLLISWPKPRRRSPPSRPANTLRSPRQPQNGWS